MVIVCYWTIRASLIPRFHNIFSFVLTPTTRVCAYFNGNHHLEEIMYCENIRRSQLLATLDKFRDVLVTCQHEDPGTCCWATTDTRQLTEQWQWYFIILKVLFLMLGWLAFLELLRRVSTRTFIPSFIFMTEHDWIIIFIQRNQKESAVKSYPILGAFGKVFTLKIVSLVAPILHFHFLVLLILFWQKENLKSALWFLAIPWPVMKSRFGS